MTDAEILIILKIDEGIYLYRRDHTHGVSGRCPTGGDVCSLSL